MNNQEYQDALNNQGIKVTAEFQGNVTKNWGGDNSSIEKRPHYKITVSSNGNSETFDFWGSIQDYLNSLPKTHDPYGEKILGGGIKATQAKKQALVNAPYDAFNCILSDALSGDDTFDMFCGDFGYDNDSRKAEAIYRECQKSLDKLRAIYSGDLYALANSLER